MTLIIKISALSLMLLFVTSCNNAKNNKQETAQATTKNTKSDLEIIAYATASNGEISKETTLQLDEIIYSFLHLKGDSLEVNEKSDEYLIYLSSLKKINPDLKVLVSLGGWGGCKTCSDVFSTEEGRKHFTESLKSVLNEYNADGIDLDWEYPVIEGYPGHQFMPEDKRNFTLLVKELREELGQEKIISFAAGGFKNYLENSIDWNEVMPFLDHVNIMSYDMVNGGSPKTGHHTSLYSTENQESSVDFAVRYLDSVGVPSDKMVIGAAFYARIWEEVNPNSNGLYQAGKFKRSVLYKDLESFMENNPGFEYFWDSEAQAPYIYNAEKGLFITYDDSLSISGKTKYALENKLGGIMFWQLSGDKPDGLLDVIDNEIKNLEN